MKKILATLFSVIIFLTISSCETQAQIYSNSDDFELVVTQGIPHYDTNGYVIYYLFGGMYYYPYLLHDRYVFHRYYRPLPYHRYSRFYRPFPRDFHRRYDNHYMNYNHLRRNELNRPRSMENRQRNDMMQLRNRRDYRPNTRMYHHRH